jgi:hypothetical protein
MLFFDQVCAGLKIVLRDCGLVVPIGRWLRMYGVQYFAVRPVHCKFDNLVAAQVRVDDVWLFFAEYVTENVLVSTALMEIPVDNVMLAELF